MKGGEDKEDGKAFRATYHSSNDLGGVCFFYLMLNRTFFELNTE